METRWGRVANGDVRTASPTLRGLGGVLVAVLIAGSLAWAGDQNPKGSPKKPSTAPKKPSTAPRKPSTSAIPQVAAIDKGIAEAWDAAGIKPTRPATDDEFLRRAY